MAARKRIYRVAFLNEGRVYEVYCEKVSHGGIVGFVELEGLLFGERTTVVVDPAEEQLKTEFAGVARTFVPLHAVVRIDEVEKRGTSHIRALPGGKAPAPPPAIYTPPKP